VRARVGMPRRCPRSSLRQRWVTYEGAAALHQGVPVQFGTALQLLIGASDLLSCRAVQGTAWPEAWEKRCG
jgi:hypothetical protein